jgi:hypothetical protein
MTSAAIDTAPATTPARVVLMIAIVLVATMPAVATGAAALGTWLARIGFSLLGAGGL